MVILHKDNLEISVEDIQHNRKLLVIKIINSNQTYKGILPNKLKIRTYDKYKLDEQLINHIYNLDVLEAYFNDCGDNMNIYIHNLKLHDGKIYPMEITISMEIFFDIDIYDDVNLDKIDDIETLKKKFKETINYAKHVGEKIKFFKYELEKIHEKKLMNDNYL